ncbi:metal-dependent hydrolase [Cupriavidus sp. UYPR2.512]|uniref:metal-dependent hydrolase n=1 Tax=Cupriavidus sp. UYPR2.512 TaxID=1080187 RepID=UPI00039BC92E|nr:metal-dependent hydrolase [Cupriavidus sp. UYPR2.512]
MDTITHALMGAHALAIPMAEVPGRRLSTRERLLLGAAAGAFPDIDFLGFLVHPLHFLAQWHSSGARSCHMKRVPAPTNVLMRKQRSFCRKAVIDADLP